MNNTNTTSNTASETTRSFSLRLFPNDIKDERARELVRLGKTRGIIESSRCWRFDYWLRIDGMELPAISHEVLDASVRDGARIKPDAELAIDERDQLIVKTHLTFKQERRERHDKHEAK